jgi:hypothetical protein
LERMRKYGLKMNPLKCVFGMTAGRFLGFIVHEQGIQVDPKKVEAINKMEEHMCKWDVQKLLGKIHYLRRFIANLAGKIDSFLPLLKLKREEEFYWGQNKESRWTRLRNIGHRWWHPWTGRSITASNGSLAFMMAGCGLHHGSQSRSALGCTNMTALRQVTVVRMGVATTLAVLAITAAIASSLGAIISPSKAHVIRGLMGLPMSRLGR